MKVSVADAKNKLPQLIKAVEAGEPVTICRHGVPVVDLIPTKQSGVQTPRLGTLKGRVIVNDADWWKPMSSEELEEFLDGRY